jgi:transcription elongation factor GreA
MSGTFPITVKGFEDLEAELKNLKSVQRPEVIEAIAVAREHGDLKENAEYHAAREKQGFIEGRIAQLEDITTRVEIVDVSKLTGPMIRFGAKVKLIDEDTDKEITYTITSEYEADIENNMLSIASPVARALIGKEIGDSVEVHTPGGSKFYEVLEVTYS